MESVSCPVSDVYLNVPVATIYHSPPPLPPVAFAHRPTIVVCYCARYYNDGTAKQGPLTLAETKELYVTEKINKETKMWAQGMEAWRSIRTIPQLKWTLVATGQGVMDLSQLAVHCLDMLIQICKLYPSCDRTGAVVRPIPRCKRMLADATCLPHIVQLLLTFDPTIVERVSELVTIIMQDNSQMPRLYLTGVFYFIMMYTGSNLLPVARFLKETHNHQAYQSEASDVRSILGPMLPKAMVCYLDNYGPDKFASTFLGEFDTPEAIWGAEMRRLLIEKIALHLADFTPRLLVNNRALYTFQYCPIPKVQSAPVPALSSRVCMLVHTCTHARTCVLSGRRPPRLSTHLHSYRAAACLLFASPLKLHASRLCTHTPTRMRDSSLHALYR